MWYFEEAGQTAGPVGEDAIRAAIAAGRIGRGTLVWREGMGGWVPAEKTELAGAFGGGAGMWPGGPPGLPVQAPGHGQPFGPGGQPQFGGAGYSAPGFSAPGFGAPGFGVPGYGMPGYGGWGGAGPRFAGFWIRFVAYVIDAILVQIGVYALSAAVGASMAEAVLLADGSIQLSNVELARFGVGTVWVCAYYLASQAGRWQATPGKRLLGLRMIRTDGRRVGVALSVGRYLGYVVSGLLLGIGFLMIGWTEQKRGLHDMMCGTRVIYGRA